MATVAEVMNRDVLAVDPTASIGEAAEKMIEGGVGAVVVMEDGVRLTGIITERDLLRAVAHRARPADPGRRPDDVRAQLPPSARLEGRPIARHRQPPPPLPIRVRAVQG